MQRYWEPAIGYALLRRTLVRFIICSAELFQLKSATQRCPIELQQFGS